MPPRYLHRPQTWIPQHPALPYLMCQCSAGQASSKARFGTHGSSSVQTQSGNFLSRTPATPTKRSAENTLLPWKILTSPAIRSMIFPRTRGGSREMTTATVTVRMIPMESHFSRTTVFPIIDAALIRLFAVMISISSPQNFHAVSLMDSRDFRFFSLSIQYPHISVRRR